MVQILFWLSFQKNFWCPLFWKARIYVIFLPKEGATCITIRVCSVSRREGRSQEAGRFWTHLTDKNLVWENKKWLSVAKLKPQSKASSQKTKWKFSKLNTVVS